MKVLTLFVILLVCTVCAVAAASSPIQKMRPYAGIGILLLPANGIDPADPLLLYEEPALARLGELNKAKIPVYDWMFGPSPDHTLIVMARKGAWMRVVYDDAGREAWLKPPRQVPFQSWELFFKRQVSRLLPGLQKKYYQSFQQPDGVPVDILSPRQPFKVLRLENDWAMILMIDQNSLDWLRWRDEDGRLLIGIEADTKERQP